jgi:hypothetical protein
MRGMRYARYLRLEKYIAASDTGGIIERWKYGRRLLEDDTATTPNGNLKHGVLAKLVAQAVASGYEIAEREIQRRLQCARTYPAETQICRAADRFRVWSELYNAGFPPVEAPPDELPFDPRDADERARDAARELARHASAGDAQLTLFDYFPDDRFTEISTLGELAKYAAEMAELTERFRQRDEERAEYLGSLIEAVSGDLSKTWAEAQAALDGAA